MLESVLSVLQVFIAVVLVFLILLHSGKDAGMSGAFGVGAIAAGPVHGRRQRPASGHRVELCVYVDDVDDVFARARERGFEVVADPADMPWDERTAWVADPDGNLV